MTPRRWEGRCQGNFAAIVKEILPIPQGEALGSRLVDGLNSKDIPGSCDRMPLTGYSDKA